MSKTKLAAVAAVLTAAQINERRVALQTELDGLAAAEQTAKQAEANKVTEVILTFPTQLKTILGREVSTEDMVNMIRHIAKNGSLSISTPGDKGKRLSDAEKAAIRADLLKHCAALKAGTTPEPLSVIAARAGIQTQTLDTYKPTKAEVDALPGTAEVPASRMQAVAAA